MLLQILVFVVVTIGLVGLTHVVSRALHRDELQVRKRLSREFSKEGDTPSQRALFKNVEALQLSSAAEEYAAFGGVNDNIINAQPEGWRKQFELVLEQANLRIPIRHFMILSLLCAVLSAAVGWILAGWGFAILFGLAGGGALLAVVFKRREQRQFDFLSQLPNAFELMARVLRAGQSVPQALRSVSEAFDGPLAAEFANCEHQQSHGLRPEVTYQEMAHRSGILELRIFVMAMTIQRQTGGNLSETLERLAQLVRSRLRLKQQIQTLTAEGRLQGLTLVILPFIVFGVMYCINRSYAEVLLTQRNLLLATLVLMIVGVLWIRRIVRMEG